MMECVLLWGALAAVVLMCGPIIPKLLRKAQVHRVSEYCRCNRILVLTYDDGPSGSTTPSVLDVLRRGGVHGTFFIVGTNARRYSTIVDRIIEEGNEVGCHTERHLHAWCVAPWTAIADIRDGMRSVQRWAGENIVFRPPKGKMTGFTWLWTCMHRVPVVWWTYVTGDYCQAVPNACDMAGDILNRGGGIILMHDSAGPSRQADFTVALTEELVNRARKKGWRIVTVKELLASMHNRKRRCGLRGAGDK